VKEVIKALVPERYRLLRYELYERGRYLPELVFSLGKAFECTFCRWQFRRLRPAGFDYPVLREKQVTGASFHLNDVCPKCMSNSRERLLHLFLQNKTDLFDPPKTLLHVAPEPNLGKLLSTTDGITYVSADLLEPDVNAHIDIMKMPFLDGTFDVILCNHVLEHVSDDRIAMNELYRILKPGGWAVLQVPIAKALTTTFEDPTAATDQRRIELFGQRDHVRLYAEGDYVNRLSAVGFRVNSESYCKQIPESHVRRHALIPDELIFVCNKG